MIIVEQTITGYPDGNCFPACLASVLELPLADVPLFCDDDWLEQYNEWLRPRNLVLLLVPYAPDWHPPGYAILGAESPRGPWLHAAVCYDGELVWDPHPQRSMGLRAWLDWAVFVVLDPQRKVG